MLEVSNLRITYHRRMIVEDLTLSPIRHGQLVSLLGPNGTGKTTLLKALAGLLPLRQGKVVLDGTDLGRISLSDRARKVVYLPQSLPASVHLRVMESVLVAARASALSDEARQITLDTVMALLERLGIANLAMRYLDELSGGQKQLVGIAQALIRRPSLLLLDEPLSALDMNYQFHVMDLLRQETHQHGLITLIVMHDLNIALRHSDACVLIRKGRLLGQGTPTEVVTPRTLARAFGVRARIESCSRGIPQVLVDGLYQPSSPNGPNTRISG